ncbi:MAG: alpha/beta hydrolase [Actinomycetes bacterium]
MTSYPMTAGAIRANEIDFAFLEAGTGPLALCLHGFPDTAWGWRFLLPALADAGYRAVAPFMRGYAPTSLAEDGHYQLGALAADAVALHDVLGGDGDAVIIGHDWGAMATYGAAALAPDRWRRVVTAAVPPLASMASAMVTYSQLRRSWYMFFFQNVLAEFAVGLNDLDFVTQLWKDWSPGHDESEDMNHVKDALGQHENLMAALGYYRAMFQPELQVPELQTEQDACNAPTPQPTLYLHGRNDGCVGIEVVEGALDYLPNPDSRIEIIENAGHFIQVEQPDIVNRLILDHIAR